MSNFSIYKIKFHVTRTRKFDNKKKNKKYKKKVLLLIVMSFLGMSSNKGEGN